MRLSNLWHVLNGKPLIVVLVFIPALSVFMHWRAFDVDLVSTHVWRQAQTQSTIISFYEEDFNILNPRQNARGGNDGIFRMEFPIMQWGFACFYKLFGNHLVISRILTFLLGLCSVWGMYVLARALIREKTAALATAWAFNFSPAFFYYTVNPLPDNFALCCGIWGMAFFFRWYENPATRYLLLTGLFLSLAALAKLPFVLYFIIPVVHALLDFWQDGKVAVGRRRIWTVLLFLIPPAAWYAWVIPGWSGNGIVEGISAEGVSMRLIFGYMLDNLVSVLPEMLLNYAAVPFFIAGLYLLFREHKYRDRRVIPMAACGMAVIAYFIFEINMIANVHDYYLFPFLPFLFILTGFGAWRILRSRSSWWSGLAKLLLVALPLTAFLRMQVRWDVENPGFNKDWLDNKAALRAAAPKNALCVVGNDLSYCIYFYYIDKKGWPFGDDRLNAEQLSQMIREGAGYLYSDSRTIDENKDIVPLLDSLILERGSVRVFRLKQ